MTWEPLNLASSDFALPAEPPEIAGLIYRGKRHVISGPPESAKSLFAFIVALEHMRAGGIVAHIDFEQGPTGSRRMLEDFGATIDEIRAVLFYEPDGPPDGEDIDRMIAAGVTLATIDAAAGAYDASALDDNLRKDAERFAATWIKPLFVNGITSITLDHVTKNGDTRGKFSIGSERKIGQADVHLGLSAVAALSRGSNGVIRITTHKDRIGFLPRPCAADLEFRSDPETHRITWTFSEAGEATSDHDAFRPTVLMAKVSQYLIDREPGPTSRSTIEKAGLGKSAKWVRLALDTLISEGYVREEAGARGARNNTSLRPFSPTSSTSSDLVSNEDDVTSSTSSPPTGGTRTKTRSTDEVSDEDLRDEVERLLAKHSDLAEATT